MLVTWDDIKVNTKDNHGCSLLSYATEHGNEVVVKILVAWYEVGHMLLSYAAQEGHEAVVKILVLQDDVEVNTKDDHGHSLLSYTTEDGDEAVVKILVAWDDADSGGHQA